MNIHTDIFTISNISKIVLGLMGHALNPPLKRQRQVDYCELLGSVVYIVSSSILRATSRDHVSKKAPQKPQNHYVTVYININIHINIT